MSSGPGPAPQAPEEPWPTPTRARATFTAPDSSGDHTFRLEVRGRGVEMGRHTGADTVSVRVTGRRERCAPPDRRERERLDADPHLRRGPRDDEPRLRLGQRGLRRGPSRPRAPALRRHRARHRGAGERSERHHDPRSAGPVRRDASRSRTSGTTRRPRPGCGTPTGTSRIDFAGFRVRNQTPRGPHVSAIAFAGAAQNLCHRRRHRASTSRSPNRSP